MTTPPLDPDFQAAKKAAKKRQLQQLRASRERRKSARELRKQASPVQAAALERQKGKRQRQREARAYAEAWWQALRAWETRNTREVVPRTKVGSGGEGSMKVVGVGNYGRLAAILEYTEVLTPIGWLSASAVARALNDSESEALERLQTKCGLSSLLRDTGRWATGGAEAGAAVLALAEALGDARAGEMTAETL